MNIARTVKKVKELPGLGHGAKQGIVASRPLLRLVETHCRSFGMPLGGLDRPVKIKGQAIKGFSLQSFDHHGRGQFPDFFYPFSFDLTKGSRDRRYVGKFPQPHQSKNQRIIPIIVDLPQTTETEQKVNNEKQDNQMASKDGRNLHVLKALLQPFPETKLSEQYLKDQQPRERGQFLIFKTDHGNFMVFGLNF
jgi:hypothetical protein